MKIGYIGCGIWAFALATLLAKKNYLVHFWCREQDIFESLITRKEHPRAPGIKAHPNIIPLESIERSLEGVDMIIEGVTSAGVRTVFESIKNIVPKVPIAITSKGIEQKTGMLLSEVLLQVLGADYQPYIGCLSGPSVAPEVLQEHPGCVVAASYNPQTALQIFQAFSSDFMRVYINEDIHGVEFGGAMKNIIAIACGISDGLGFGNNTKAALITRGLHEMRSLAKVKGCNPETINGLSGLGDLCLTCMSSLSRNHRLGTLLASGKTFPEAKKIIGMATEGAYTCISALELAKLGKIELPITQAIYSILYEGKESKEVIRSLLLGGVKQEIA